MSLDMHEAIKEYATAVFNCPDYDSKKLELRRTIHLATGVWGNDLLIQGQRIIIEYTKAATHNDPDVTERVDVKLCRLKNTPHHRRQLEHYLLSL